MSKRLVVLGGGESGVGAAILGKKKGFEVWLSDSGSLKKEYKDVLLNNEIEFEEGSHSLERLFGADVVVKSPGIPSTADLVQQLLKRGIPVISEIEWASRFTKAQLIGITGSNGKTTTVSMVYHLLKRAGLKVGLAGNIGYSFAQQVAEKDFDTYVLELSSFQLEDIETLKIDIAVLLNITPDHLDRYDYQMEKYVAAKFRILNRADENAVLVFCNEDQTIVNELSKRTYLGTKQSYGVSAPTNAQVLNNELQSKNGFVLSCKELQLKGKHNWMNAMAALLVAEQVGLSSEQITEGLTSFQAIEHRLESVQEWKGVEYINDSKATNVDATYYALDAMEKPIIWIVGGVDKGNDYQVLEELVVEKVKGIVCLGKDNSKLKEFFGGKVPLFKEANSAKEAVVYASEMGVQGDVVLLSPACASFDLFKNYQDRGKQFKQAINNLTITIT